MPAATHMYAKVGALDEVPHVAQASAAAEKALVDAIGSRQTRLTWYHHHGAKKFIGGYGAHGQ